MAGSGQLNSLRASDAVNDGSKLAIIGSDNGLSPGRCQAITWTNAGILLMRTLRTNFNEILIKIHIVSFKKMHLKMSSAKWLPSCLSLNVLNKKPVSFGYGEYNESVLAQVMSWDWTGIKPLPETILAKMQTLCYFFSEKISFLIEDKDSFLLYSQYHGCWWLGSSNHQGISSHGIYRVLPEHSAVSSRIKES